MSYLWENYSVDNNYSLARKRFVPYTEIFNASAENIKVNVLYRFADLYFKLFGVVDDNMESSGRQVDENVLFHLLAHIDMYSGLSKKELYMLKIYDDLKNGYYQIDMKLFDGLLFVHQYIILSYMYIRKNDRKDCKFFDCLSEVFDTKIYHSDFKDVYLVQISEDSGLKYNNGKYTAKQLYDLIKELLCDFWIKVEEYWKIPIGVIGDKIEVDNVQLV